MHSVLFSILKHFSITIGQRIDFTVREDFVVLPGNTLKVIRVQLTLRYEKFNKKQKKNPQINSAELYQLPQKYQLNVTFVHLIVATGLLQSNQDKTPCDFPVFPTFPCNFSALWFPCVPNFFPVILQPQKYNIYSTTTTHRAITASKLSSQNAMEPVSITSIHYWVVPKSKDCS